MQTLNTATPSNTGDKLCEITKHYDFETLAYELDEYGKRIPGRAPIKLSASGTFEGTHHSMHRQLVMHHVDDGHPVLFDSKDTLASAPAANAGCCGCGQCSGTCKKPPVAESRR